MLQSNGCIKEVVSKPHISKLLKDYQNPLARDGQQSIVFYVQKAPCALFEAKEILVILGIFLIISYIWYLPLVPLGILAILFVLYFFRDPKRVAPDNANVAVAPADGHIVAIEERIESDRLMQRMICISIFLSIFDVHVNRSPIAGKIIHSKAQNGRYLDARNPDSARKNTNRLWIIEGAKVTVAVRQITGAIARRIVPWSQIGDELAQGEKFGMIRFGSRTELYVPEGSKILVRVGESVRGGVTPMVEFSQPDQAS